MRRRRQIRISHAHVNNVGSGVPRGGLGSIDLFEHIRRQTADTVELFHWSGLREPANSPARTIRSPTRLILKWNSTLPDGDATFKYTTLIQMRFAVESWSF